MKNRLYRFSISILLLFILVIATGCSNDEDNNANNNNGDITELALEGNKIVRTSCIGCHGRDLSGDMGPGLLHLNLTDDELMDVLIKGKGAMPPATANGMEEEVIAYLKTIQK